VRITVEDDDGAGYLQPTASSTWAGPRPPSARRQSLQMTVNLAFNLPRLGGYGCEFAPAP
jgi:hypothetical protein